VSKFHYAKDITRTSTGAFPAAQNGGGGRIADAGGTGWTTLDLTGRWRPQGMASSHMLSFGVHADQYRLVNPTYNTNDWIDGDAIGSAAIDARGTTQTKALWLQDVWRLTPSIMATLGGRYETWRAYGGEANRPARGNAGFSPKASLTWQAKEQWQVTGSLGKAVRFPTVGELYQTVQTGATSTQANPLLKPESVLAGELAIERNTADGKLRISLFQEHVSDALIAQTSMLPGFTTPVSFVQNVDKTRQRGIELATQQKNFLIRGLELSGSLTYVDARILANSGYVATTPGTSSVGKRTPYVPDWRATLVATYRPDDQWAYTLAGRYSGRLFGTVDNTDINPATYQGFESFFVLDARVRYRLNRQWSAALGVDNISNRKYFLFHPFPQRSLFAELKYEY
jgi:iron complex outermembrane receptor protein